MTVTYDWATDQTTINSNITTDLVYPVTTAFSVITTVDQAPVKGSVGIKVTDGPNSLYFVSGPMTGVNVIPLPLGISYMAMEWSNTDKVFYPYTSVDGIVWDLWPMLPDEEGVPAPYPTFDAPTHAGVCFISNDPLENEVVVLGSPRVFTSLLFAGDDDFFVIPFAEEELKPIGAVPPTQPDPVTPQQEAIIHGLVGAPFGDLEFDVGKSVGWLQRFVDDIFVTDVNRGDQRYWVVNWTKTFAYTYYKFSPLNYFTDTEAYRQGQWTDATNYARNYPNELVYDDNDWVIFLDAHEGLSADNRSFPDDILIETYKSFIYREIARATDNDRVSIVLPFYVFLRHDHIQNVSQSYTFEDDVAPTTFTTTQSVGVPYYLPYMGLTRMFKVSVLKDPDFDWSILDTPVAVVDPSVKLQIVSYAYAHWNLPEVPPGQTTVPPLDADNDDGWKQRCIMSQAMAIPGLPVGSASDPVGTWVSPASDPPGLRGPWAPECYSLKITDPVIPFPPPPVAAEVAGVRVPMYDLTFRLNVRDGVWYTTDGFGPAEVVWDEDAEEFVPYIPA